MLLCLSVEVGRERSLRRDGQVGTQMLDAGGSDDGAGQVRMAEREAQHELQPRQAVQAGTWALAARSRRFSVSISLVTDEM